MCRFDPSVQGRCAPGFEPVREVFTANFANYPELGAAFAVSRGGELVVDLWGGFVDEARTTRWAEDTLQVIFSGTKGLVAVCLLMLVDRGEVELDAPVARYWPEFAERGKERVRGVELAAHQARLPGIYASLTEDDILEGRRMAELLAAQPMETDPRAAGAYHALTYGWLCGELIRRVDGRSVGKFFAEEVASPLGLDLWIGLPPEFEARVAELAYGPNWGRRHDWDVDTSADDELLNRVWSNPPLFPPGRMPWNQPGFHEAEIPAAGGIGSARSLARLYDCLAAGGEVAGVKLLESETLRRGRQQVTRRWDALVEELHACGVGFQLQTHDRIFGPPEDAFEHSGAGGSIHCAWPSERVGLSYSMN